MILNTHYAYGGGSANQAVIVVTAPTGSTVTATLEGNVLTAQEINGTWTFKVRKFGAYTVTATLGSQTASAQVNVTEAKTYEVTLAYTFKVTITGDGGGSISSTSDAYVTIDGRQYKNSTVVEVQSNTVINVRAYRNTSYNRSSGVYLNGVLVNPNITAGGMSYNVTVNGDIAIQLSWTSSNREPKASICSRANIIY